MEKLSANTNALNWFEISVLDAAKAKTFYETILDTKLEEVEMMGMHMMMLPSQPPHVGGALVKSDYHTPGMTGSVVYLNANPDLQKVLDRVETAGGKIEMPKTLINEETGYMALIHDTEGNRIGLHSGN